MAEQRRVGQDGAGVVGVIVKGGCTHLHSVTRVSEVRLVTNQSIQMRYGG